MVSIFFTVLRKETLFPAYKCSYVSLFQRFFAKMKIFLFLHIREQIISFFKEQTYETKVVYTEIIANVNN